MVGHTTFLPNSLLPYICYYYYYFYYYGYSSVNPQACSVSFAWIRLLEHAGSMWCDSAGFVTPRLGVFCIFCIPLFIRYATLFIFPLTSCYVLITCLGPVLLFVAIWYVFAVPLRLPVTFCYLLAALVFNRRRGE